MATAAKKKPAPKPRKPVAKAKKPVAKPKKPVAKPKKYCRTVTRKVRVNGKLKKKKVKVCTTRKPAPKRTKTTVKPKPSFVLAPIPASKLPAPSAELPPSPVAPIDPQPPTAPPPADTPQQLNGPLTAAQAERMLWRAGFGPRPGHIAALTGVEAAEAVRSFTRTTTVSLTGPEPTSDNGFPLAPLDLWGHDHCAWLDRMVRCNQPLTERMALIFHDWFANSRGVVNPGHLQAHIQLFRDHGLGTFDNLLTRVTKDPSMLIFLNGMSNTKWNPNENYAREVMELFALGAERGAYTETDIREAAKALTGWRSTWDSLRGDFVNFRYDPTRHTTGNKTIFGQTGDFGWEDVVRLCVDHPLHASFFCTKMWSYFVPTTPDDVTLARLIEIYTGSGRSIRAVVEAILQHPQCLDGPRMVTPPVVYAAGLLRATGGYIRTENWSYLCEMAGQRLFWPPNVSGWNDRRWLDSSTLRGRWHIARQALKRVYIDPWPVGGSNYDSVETPALAISRALQVLDNPSITDEARTALLACSDASEATITATWQRAPYKAMRQNALRMLIATSPDRQTC